MYDSSLDQFVTDNWKNIDFYNYLHPDYPNYYHNRIHVIRTKPPVFYYNHSFSHYKTPEMNWFGFDFTSKSNYSLIKRKYNNQIQKKSRIPKGAKYAYGKVFDELGPIAGVNIVVKGTTRGVTTNFDGEFDIMVQKGETLVFSYLGKRNFEQEITNYNKLDINLEEDILTAGEVVVTGALGIKRKVDAVTSSYTVINGEELQNDKKPNIVQSLVGKVSGLQIVTSNDKNKTQRLVINGNRSITSNNNVALIIIDGEVSSIAFLEKLEPNLIQEISVIHGVQGSALYGPDGANGVLVVTTKKGMQELTQVKTRTNFNETAFFYPHLTTDEEGKIAFNFTTPESLTKWKLRLFGHNKKTETGYFETNIISQKDVMIVPNMPRFVREMDSLTITAKIINLTNEVKNGTAILLLFDATTGISIDSITSNKKNIKNFSCKGKENTYINWNITIPENLQGLQYKIIAKSGGYSDGEENILPVLTNKVLITESIPLWVRENSIKEVVLENLKNNSSSTLQNHLLTLEYTTNPTWLAIQSLPYLMEYEHECAEQTFSRFYANTIATQIINSNPKINAIFESWKNKETQKSKIEINDELKSILLTETPWFFDTDEEQKNKQLALLFDLNKLSETTKVTFTKLKEKQLGNGSFPWFSGGNENPYITQHIIAGLAHLSKMFPNNEFEFEPILKTGIKYIDANFIKNNTSKKNSFYNYNSIDLHYLYTRSSYINEYPLSEELKTVINSHLKEMEKNWLSYSLYQKAQMALVFNRFGNNKFAKQIILHLEESASNNTTDGMFWTDNANGHYWYNSKIETQAMLIEAFNEITTDKKKIDLMKVWLIKNKQTKNWSTTKATSEAIYALLLNGSDWSSINEDTTFKIGKNKIESKKIFSQERLTTTGYINTSWNSKEIKTEMANISIENNSIVPGFGGIYWQYFENLDKIKKNKSESLSIIKEYYKKQNGKLIAINDGKVNLGDAIIIRLIITTKDELEFVHLKDLRATCFEPKNVLSEYKWDELNYYMSTKDAATHFFFDKIHAGIYTIEYEVIANNKGHFNDGIATLQSMYSPEFNANSNSIKIICND